MYKHTLLFLKTQDQKINAGMFDSGNIKTPEL